MSPAGRERRNLRAAPREAFPTLGTQQRQTTTCSTHAASLFPLDGPGPDIRVRPVAPSGRMRRRCDAVLQDAAWRRRTHPQRV